MTGATLNTIQTNYRNVLEQIEQAAAQAGRSPADVRLVVVTKGHPVAAVEEALAAGARIFGENYVEEGVAKLTTVAAHTPGVEWHMIGHVQSRKAQPVAEHFDWVHSVDSLKLAQRLDRFAGQSGRRLPVLLECNVSGEESKFGWSAAGEAQWDALLPSLEQIARLPNLDLRGLMTMAPFFDEAEPARPYFRRLRTLRDFLTDRLAGIRLSELSMGMSGDFTVAIQEGATLVRIGTAIMGHRPGVERIG
jgi:pyridoxal phosphate enzyme (YggS family)